MVIWGWGLFKYKALPAHSNPGNAGKGWTHPEKPVTLEELKKRSAPRDWQQGESFPWDWQATIDEVKEFANHLAMDSGFGNEYELEIVWNPEFQNLPGEVGTVSDIVLLRGGAEHYAYYPGDNGSPLAAPIQNKEKQSTDKYMEKLWGGKRPGAGRPPTGRKARRLQATDEEWALILKYADEVRGK